MAHVHTLTSAQAQKELIAAVKATQGSEKTASWKPAARPSWWIDNHVVTLGDNSEVRTGIFDCAEKRKWKKSHYQASLFLYEQWRSGGLEKEECKEELKAEEEIHGETIPPITKKRRGKKEESILQEPSNPRREARKGRGKRAVEEITDVGRYEPGEERRTEEESENQARTRSRRNIRFKKGIVTLPKLSPSTTPRTCSQRSSSSSEQSEESPSPIIRRTRARARKQNVKVSPKIQPLLRKPPAKTTRRRTGKAVVRVAPETEARRDPISRPPDINSSHSTHSNRRSDAPHEEDEVAPVRMNQEEIQSKNQRSARLSTSSLASSPSRPKTRKRLHSGGIYESTNKPPRTPLQERRDDSNLQDRRAKKKRKVSGSNETPSDKENRTPPAAKPKSARYRSNRGKSSKPANPEADVLRKETTNDENSSQEKDAVYHVADQERREKRIKFLREKIALANAKRDHALKLIEDSLVDFEADCNIQKRQFVEKLRAAYRTKKLKFSRQILDMHVAKFAVEHGGSFDEWMMHDTEEGVNEMFEALNRGEDPKEGTMGPPRTPTAMSRRAALATTARKTRRKVAEEAPATGFTVRRSQRTAAKVATARTRAIVSCTPRTARREAPAQEPPHPPQTPTGIPQAGPRLMPNFAGICSRQQMATLAKSIRKQEDPVEALRAFTAQLQREVGDMTEPPMEAVGES